jgi:hypothetical protein
METLELKKELKYLYEPSARQVQAVEVPAFNFAMIDGRLEPDTEPATSPQFQDALVALYGLSYTLKFACKKREDNPVDYPVMALEGLWTIDSSIHDYTNKGEWDWTLMIMQPSPVTTELYQAALQQVKAKKDNPAVEKLHFENFHEGLCLQMMHVGPYATEPETVEKIHLFARENGYILHGRHHEIYTGDPRRANPENLKTVLRYPVKKEG